MASLCFGFRKIEYSPGPVFYVIARGPESYSDNSKVCRGEFVNLPFFPATREIGRITPSTGAKRTKKRNQ